ncbi:MAG: glycosyltransferase family 4 protein [Chloroflexi bacterium]|nr:glycosyltransferase family 4 protein [Chloroflexota bacterium]
MAYNGRVSADRIRSKTPRLGLIATLLSTASSYRSAGLHTYSHQLLHHLATSAKVGELHAFVGDRAYAPPSSLHLHYPILGVRHPLQRIVWEQSMLPGLARRWGISLLHGLANALPVLSHIPSVVTVHDLSFMRYPQAFRPGNRFYLSRITALSCRRARRVIAVSRATAADIQHYFHIPADKISVIYNGVDSIYRPLPPAEVSAYRQKAGWPERFILTVGTLEPRKNHLTLLEAYARYRTMTSQPLPLLIGGGRGWYYETIFARVQALGLSEHVHFLGFVPLEALPWLYNSATLFVYPSLYEGFGLPLAEAMACGTPAITSQCSSLPEVAGDAALLIDPQQPDMLATAMRDILASPERQQTMRTAGLKQTAPFRWEHTAAATAQLYQQLLQSTSDD